MSKRYTQAQKLAYYKRKASMSAAPRGRYVSGRGAYKVKARRRAAPRRRAHYRGRGDYSAENVPTKYASPLSRLGHMGAGIGDGLSHIFGWGAYSVKQNVLLEDPLPVINSKAGAGGTTIRHREYIGDIITGAANTFNLQSYPINPAQETTFPWLAQVAANYEQYRIDGMLFEFRTMSADALNSTNTALGQVIMATDYNAANPSFKQKSEMENYEFGSSCKPSCSQIHPIECARAQTTITELYTRANQVPPGEDVRLYDLGNFQIATNGFQAANVNVGELWVTYQVTLLKTKMYASLGNYNTLSTWHSSNPSVAAPFGTTGFYSFNSIPVVVSSNASNQGVITFPPSQIVQTYVVQGVWTGTAGVTGLAFTKSYINCAPINGGTGTYGFLQIDVPTSTSSAVYWSFQNVIQTEGDGLVAQMEVAMTTIPGGTVSMNLTVSQIPNLVVM